MFLLSHCHTACGLECATPVVLSITGSSGTWCEYFIGAWNEVGPFCIYLPKCSSLDLFSAASRQTWILQCYSLVYRGGFSKVEISYDSSNWHIVVTQLRAVLNGIFLLHGSSLLSLWSLVHPLQKVYKRSPFPSHLWSKQRFILTSFPISHSGLISTTASNSKN